MDEIVNIADVMDGLRKGRLSRNRDFEFFESPAAGRAHQSLNRLLSLAREASLDGSLVDLSSEGGLVAVTVRVKKLGYTRKALLREWESEYFFGRLYQ